MKLGIIGAMREEVQTLLDYMKDEQESDRGGMSFFEGTLEDLDVVVVQSGIGKVNAAVCVQILCTDFHVTHIVNTGVAGSLDAQLDICDMLISRDAMYHDVDVTIFGYPYGHVPGVDVTAFPADELLMQTAYRAAEEVNPGHTRFGRVASGDQFIADHVKKAEIIAHTHASCCEMEGAAIAQVAYRNKVPFVILRAISDKADGNGAMDYPTFESISAIRCAEVTRLMSKKLAELDEVY